MEDAITIFAENAETEVPIARLPSNSLARLLSLLPRLMGFSRTVKRELPSHPLSIRSDLRQWGSSNRGKRGISAAQMLEIGDMVHAKGTPHTASMLARAKHEVVDDQLVTAIEEIYKAFLSFGSVEFKSIRVGDLYHRKFSA
jgi:hypothetical protein